LATIANQKQSPTQFQKAKTVPKDALTIWLLSSYQAQLSQLQELQTRDHGFTESDPV